MHNALLLPSTISFEERSLSASQEEKAAPPERLKTLSAFLTAAYDFQKAAASKPMRKIEKNNLSASKKEALKLAVALQHVDDASLVSSSCCSAQEFNAKSQASWQPGKIPNTAETLASNGRERAETARHLHSKGTLHA